MERFGLARNFAVIPLLLLPLGIVPLGLLAWANVSTVSEQVTFNWMEHVGVVYLNPVKKFLHEIQRHRVLTVAALTGANPYQAALRSAQAEADKLATEMTALTAELAPRLSQTYGSALKTSAYWKKISTEWDEIKDKKFASAAEADAAYEALTSKVADFILNYVANYSNLILDPDLDSYWLMDAFVAKLPAISQTVSKAATLSLIGAVDETKNQARLLDLAAHYRVATGTVTDLRDVNMATAFNETINVENPNRGNKVDLKSNLEGKVTKAVDQVNRHANDVAKMAFENKAPLTGSVARSATLQTLETLDDVHALWNAISPELDWLCLKRADQKYGRRRSVTVVMFAGATFVTTLLYLAGIFFTGLRFVGYLSDRRKIAATSNQSQ